MSIAAATIPWTSVMPFVMHTRSYQKLSSTIGSSTASLYNGGGLPTTDLFVRFSRSGAMIPVHETMSVATWIVGYASFAVPMLTYLICAALGVGWATLRLGI